MPDTDEAMAALGGRLRGRMRQQVPLGPRTWFQVGGPAEWLFTPEDHDDLQLFLRERPRELPTVVLGVGSNLLIRDGGLHGVAVRLGRGFAGITALDEHHVAAGAAALDLNVALLARDHGIGGLEFLSGIPGTIGGALAMNAGAYGEEIANVLVEAQALDGEGNPHRLTPAELNYRYRHADLPEGWLFTGAVLRGRPDDPDAIAARMDKIADDRQATQPVKARTGGSTFTNPPGEKAWRLIDAAGCRGLTIGQAQVSEKHCNFLLNLGGATAADLEALGETVRERVRAQSGIALDWEIKRIGNTA